jgi:hypothetical protein
VEFGQYSNLVGCNGIRRSVVIIIIIIIINLFTAIVLSPGSSGYFTCKQNMKLVTTKFKSGGLHEKHVVSTCKLGTISAFAYRHRETKKNLCQDGRSQDLPSTDFYPAVKQ